jgi:mono/diheme cytochrome c family protein
MNKRQPFAILGRQAALLLCAIPILIALGLAARPTAPAGAQTSELPLAPPDAGSGATLYLERCANCHGPEGAGDGELAVNLPAPPASLREPEVYRTLVPAEMFDLITSGRLEQGMPPFGPTSSNPIAIADRWNLTAAVFTLGLDEEAIAAGEALYTASCSECHGGDGTTLPDSDLSDLTYWSQNSNQRVFDALPAVEEHAYDLGDDELLTVVDYTRTFSFLTAEQAAALRTIELVTVNGRISNGTTGEAATGDVTATIRAFAGQSLAAEYTTNVGPDGSFSLDIDNADVEWIYFADVLYNDVSYVSPVGEASRELPLVDLPVTVYDVTDSPENVSIEHIIVVIDFLDDAIAVSELYSFSNSVPEVFIGETGNPQEGTVAFFTPAGVENLTFQRPLGTTNVIPASEVITTGTGFADTLPLRPGRPSSNLLVRYTLPYDRSLQFAHPVAYNVGSVVVSLADVGVTLEEADGWQRSTNTGMGGDTITYIGPPVAADGAFNFKLEGRPQRQTDESGNQLLVRDDTTELIVGSAAILLGALGAVFLLQRARQGNTIEDRFLAGERDDLLEAIADLDDDYASGQIGEGKYQRQRRRLKAQLLDLWDESGGG